jgi:hypothetical protein
MYEAWHRGDGTQKGGVVRRSGVSAGHTLNTRVDVYSVDEYLLDMAAVRRFLDAQLGCDYDFRGVFGFITRRDAAQKQNAWFCSEYGLEACRVGGLELLSRLPSHRAHPGLLSLSPRMTYLGHALTGRWPLFFPDAAAAQARLQRVAAAGMRMSRGSTVPLPVRLKDTP